MYSQILDELIDLRDITFRKTNNIPFNIDELKLYFKDKDFKQKSLFSLYNYLLSEEKSIKGGATIWDFNDNYTENINKIINKIKLLDFGKVEELISKNQVKYKQELGLFNYINNDQTNLTSIINKILESNKINIILNEETISTNYENKKNFILELENTEKDIQEVDNLETLLLSNNEYSTSNTLISNFLSNYSNNTTSKFKFDNVTEKVYKPTTDTSQILRNLIDIVANYKKEVLQRLTPEQQQKINTVISKSINIYKKMGIDNLSQDIIDNSSIEAIFSSPKIETDLKQLNFDGKIKEIFVKYKKNLEDYKESKNADIEAINKNKTNATLLENIRQAKSTYDYYLNNFLGNTNTNTNYKLFCIKTLLKSGSYKYTFVTKDNIIELIYEGLKKENYITPLDILFEPFLPKISINLTIFKQIQERYTALGGTEAKIREYIDIMTGQFFIYATEILKEYVARTKNISSICDNRVTEGKFINNSLENLREIIKYCLSKKNEKTLNAVPNYIDICLNTYCGKNTTTCFKSEKIDPKIKTPSSILFDTIFKVLYKDEEKEIKQFYKEIIISIFCVFNISKSANNPPPVPYIDINQLKSYIYNSNKSNTNFNHNKDKIRLYSAKLFDLIKYYAEGTSYTTEILPSSSLVIPKNETPITAIQLLTKDSKYKLYNDKIEIILDEPQLTTGDYKILTDFIELIDNSNAISAIGTLEYLDTMSKFNKTSVICKPGIDEKLTFDKIKDYIKGTNPNKPRFIELVKMMYTKKEIQSRKLFRGGYGGSQNLLEDRIHSLEQQLQQLLSKNSQIEYPQLGGEVTHSIVVEDFQDISNDAILSLLKSSNGYISDTASMVSDNEYTGGAVAPAVATVAEPKDKAITNEDALKAVANTNNLEKARKAMEDIDDIKRNIKNVLESLDTINNTYKRVYEPLFNPIDLSIKVKRYTIAKSNNALYTELTGIYKTLSDEAKKWLDDSKKELNANKDNLTKIYSSLKDLINKEAKDKPTYDLLLELKRYFDGDSKVINAQDPNSKLLTKGLLSTVDILITKINDEYTIAYSIVKSIASGDGIKAQPQQQYRYDNRGVVISNNNNDKENEELAHFDKDKEGRQAYEETLRNKYNDPQNVGIVINFIILKLNDLVNKVILTLENKYKVNSDPTYASVVTEPALFSILYNKFVDERNTDGSFMAAQNLVQGLRANSLLPYEILKVSSTDKMIFLFVSLIIRLISVTIMESMIQKDVVRNITFSMLGFFITYTILFLAFVTFVNFDKYRMRIIFNYVNMHNNTGRIISHLMAIFIISAVILFIITNMNITNIKQPTYTLNEQQKAQLCYRFEVCTLLIWLFLLMMIILM